MASSSIIRSEILVMGSSREVMSKLSDLTLLPMWSSNILQCEKISHGHIAIGSKFEIKSNVMGLDLIHEVVITSFTPESDCTMESYSGPIPFVITFNLETCKTSTLIKAEYDLDFSSLGNIVAKMAHNITKIRFEKDLVKLKYLIESTSHIEPSKKGI